MDLHVACIAFCHELRGPIDPHLHGGQIVLSTQDLRALGAEIADALCVINRNPSTPAPLTDAGLTLHALLTAEDLTPRS